MCKFCEQKSTYDYRSDIFSTNRETLIQNGNLRLYMGLNEFGRYCINAVDTISTEDVEINYCPFCGKELKSEPQKEINLAIKLIKEGKYDEARKVADAHKIIMNLHEMIDLMEENKEGLWN